MSKHRSARRSVFTYLDLWFHRHPAFRTCREGRTSRRAAETGGADGRHSMGLAEDIRIGTGIEWAGRVQSTDCKCPECPSWPRNPPNFIPCDAAKDRASATSIGLLLYMAGQVALHWAR